MDTEMLKKAATKQGKLLDLSQLRVLAGQANSAIATPRRDPYDPSHRFLRTLLTLSGHRFETAHGPSSSDPWNKVPLTFQVHVRSKNYLQVVTAPGRSMVSFGTSSESRASVSVLKWSDSIIGHCLLKTPVPVQLLK